MSPAVHFLLMTGRQASVRVPDWVQLAIDVVTAADLASLRNELFPLVAAELEAEAAPFDFIPWGKAGRRPRGPGVQAWEQQFLATHRY